MPLPDNRPLAIGANFHDDPLCRNTNRKSQVLAIDSRRNDATYAPHTEYRYNGLSSGDEFAWMYQTSSATAHGRTTGSLGQSASGSTAAADDAPTLRFLAYTRDVILESNRETTRIRKMGIVFHVQDGSIAIREAKQANSGMPQGQVLLRQQVPRSPTNVKDILGIDDFDIGATIVIYDRPYHIVDCDERTRQYLRNVLGRDVPDMSLPWPKDEDTYNNNLVIANTRHPKKAMPSNLMDQKRVVEQLASGIISKHPPDEVRMAQQFLRNKINEHLQFAAVWDDRKSISGDLRRCAIRYFLENDTVEIIEIRPDNAGREGGCKLLCRQRVAKTEADDLPLHAAPQNTFGIILKDGYLEPLDFKLGEHLRIHKRNYFIHDADAFTRAYLKENFAVELPPAVDITEVLERGKVQLPVQVPPPHDGFGTEEDSFQNWKYLSLKPPPADFEKLENESGKVMTFAASLAPPVAPEEAGRQFVINYYRATDEIEIIENNVRNSGVVGGKFLAKRRHLKRLPDGRQVPYAPADFNVGGTVTILQRTFVLDSIDRRSKRLVDGIPYPVTEDRVRELVIVFKTLLQSKFLRIHEAYRVLAPGGTLTIKELMEFFRSSTCTIREEEALLLLQYISPNRGGVIAFEDFVKVMDVPNSHNIDESSMHPRSVKNVNLGVRTEFANATVDAADIALRRNLRRQLVDKLAQRRATLQEVFRLMAGNRPNGKLNRASFATALNELLHFNVSAKEQRILVDLLFYGQEDSEGDITIKQFHEFIESS